MSFKKIVTKIIYHSLVYNYYKPNCLSIFADINCFLKKSKESTEMIVKIHILYQRGAHLNHES